MSRPSEHDYMASLPELPVDHPKKTHPPIGDSSRSQDLDLNLGATELRLGLPGSKPPPRERDFLAHDVEVSYTLGNFPKNFASGAKRGFSDAIDLRRSGNWGLADGLGRDHSNSTSQTAPNGPGSGSRALVKSTEALRTENRAQNSGAQVVGWPPIRSFRKNTMATANPPNKTNNAEKKVEPKQEAAGGCLYVKVSMDGAPYLRKVNLKIYSSYSEISTALEKMFSCFTLGQYGYHGVAGRDGGLSESRLIDLLRGSDYVLTYEDKDGDWMLVGDVPWNMFTSSCRRLRITKSSEAVGLAKDKSKNEE